MNLKNKSQIFNETAVTENIKKKATNIQSHKLFSNSKN